MCKIIQKVKLANQGQLFAHGAHLIEFDGVKKMEIELLVDTGAAMICLPLSIINELELKKIDEKKAQTANGVVVKGIDSAVQIKIYDRIADINVIALPDDGTPPLLGYLTLETLDLYPNPQKQILESNPKHDGKMVVDLL